MGYIFVTAPCCVCHEIFNFNPHRVPSVVVKGVREPLCRECVERANPLRIDKGLPEIKVLPGAYDALPEDEL